MLFLAGVPNRDFARHPAAAIEGAPLRFFAALPNPSFGRLPEAPTPETIEALAAAPSLHHLVHVVLPAALPA